MSPPRISSRAPARPTEPREPPRPARNEVKPQPQARTNRPGMSGVSQFESPASRQPLVALNSPTAAAQGSRVTPGSYPTAAQVRDIAAMQDPVARNYAITQGYSDLSNAMGQLLGTENANWSTFATWASKQAGVSIRGEDMPKFFTDALKQADNVMGPLSKVDDLLRKLGLPALPLGDIAAAGNQALQNVSQSIADGNKVVFEEVGQEFARFVETFQGDTQYDAAKVAQYLNGFPADKPVLKEAFGHYAQAMFEKDPNKKAELMLLANDKVGLHEQTRLQPYVEKALNAPVKETFRGILKQTIEAHINALPFPANLAGKAALKTGLVDAALNPVVDGAASVFRRLATEHMMKLAVPGEALKLGNDLPPPAGMESTIFPPHLRTIENPELRVLLDQLDKSPDSLKGTGAKDWSQLDQRMNYIVDLFRSRQSDPALFDPPFGQRGTYPVAPQAPRVS
ncbi:hypothetical protein [Comamonas sp. JC664]|uniref:hypothetical protein n=1 Tax=Comamonas sp. JC664 TaxID=2801917 RepID=UPI00174E734C|nr:hypothetical protein [Comamonas sp. JC664]MBL0697888.1 hypothetical protein [Comamonas sp. JC664]GHG70173.1 hypothetical protein GCM10012319_14840 [Comamonas sp. KCTC 72670]